MLIFLLALTACDEPLKGDVSPDDQLESAEVSHDLPQTEPAEVSLSGSLTVSGADRDWVLELSDDSLAQTVHVNVHSPGQADLSVLAGAQVEALLPADWFAEHYSLLLQDEAGPLYILDMGLHPDETNSLMGEGFVRHGEVRAVTEDNTWTTSYTSIAFRTDAGTTQLLPGEVQVLEVGGVKFRATAIAAWTRVAKEGASLPGCPVAEELLSYELIRVAEEVEPELIVRPDGLDPASAGCL